MIRAILKQIYTYVYILDRCYRNTFHIQHTCPGSHNFPLLFPTMFPAFSSHKQFVCMPRGLYDNYKQLKNIYFNDIVTLKEFNNIRSSITSNSQSLSTYANAHLICSFISLNFHPTRDFFTHMQT